LVHCLIRHYAEEDFNDYAETLLKTWPCESVKEARDDVAIAVKKAKEGREEEEIWVAEIEGRAVGFMLLAFTSVWGHAGEAFEEKAVCIDWFDVHPDFQRQGIGAELLHKAMERAKEEGLQRIFAHTATSNLAMINFASKNGFRFTKHLKEFWGKGTGDAFLLIKDLA
jgi:ribosomal protein S18 acetylase RimI-like enzyme